MTRVVTNTHTHTEFFRAGIISKVKRLKRARGDGSTCLPQPRVLLSLERQLSIPQILVDHAILDHPAHACKWCVHAVSALGRQGRGERARVGWLRHKVHELTEARRRLDSCT
jgi:hypothetical protein